MTNTLKQRKPVIGLLGGVGSGKTLVAGQLESLGCAVIDADALAREVLARPAVIEQLYGWWGRANPGVLDQAGQVDRRAVGRMVFAEKAQLERLEGLVHPLVQARRVELMRDYQARAGVLAVVEDCPLLLEKQLDGGCDVLIYVDVPRQMRLKRLQRTRDWTEADLARREKNQLPLDIKRSRADYVLDNSADQGHCFEQVRRVFSQILQR